MRRGNYKGEEAAHFIVQGLSAVSCAETAKPTDLSFRLWTRVGPTKHVLDGAQILHAKGQ